MRKVKDLERKRKNLIGVAPTEKGEEAYRRSRDRNAIRNIMSCLSEKKKDDLRTYLETLRNKALAELSELRVGYQLPFP